MGFLRLLRKIKRKQCDYRILILGLDNAGKTTIVKRLLNENIHGVMSTIGFDIQTIFVDNIRINLWDIGGQRSLRDFWRNYFESNDGLIWVVDSADKYHLEDCRREFDSLLGEEKLKKCSVLILANKMDLGNRLSKDDVAKVLDLNRMHNTHWNIFECSAMTGYNVFEGFQWLINDIKERTVGTGLQIHTENGDLVTT